MEAYSLQTLLEVIAKGTIVEGAKMRIEAIPPALRCKECDFTFLTQDSTLVCPHCRSGKLEDLECNFAE